MILGKMRYKTYIWPHNPRVYTIDYTREVAAQKIPFGAYHLQDLGLSHRVMRGEGAFYGENAYEEFKKLASVFYQEGPGPLVHPIWQTTSAYFVALSLQQEPMPDYVSYAFTFIECAPTQETGLTELEEPGVPSAGGTAQTGGGRYHTVARGESLWKIAARYGSTLSKIIALNPQIKNPNLIHVGERVRVE